jgi:copper chaperone
MTTYSIPEMSCGHCKATIEKTVLGLDPAAALTFDLQARQVSIDTTTPLASLQSALKAEGYEATAL